MWATLPPSDTPEPFRAGFHWVRKVTKGHANHVELQMPLMGFKWGRVFGQELNGLQVRK